eukprot:1159326-Pelagomonas_calceolata.AAC.8
MYMTQETRRTAMHGSMRMYVRLVVLRGPRIKQASILKFYMSCHVEENLIACAVLHTFNAIKTKKPSKPKSHKGQMTQEKTPGAKCYSSFLSFVLVVFTP